MFQANVEDTDIDADREAVERWFGPLEAERTTYVSVDGVSLGF